jgi:hypothetical protein
MLKAPPAASTDFHCLAVQVGTQEVGLAQIGIGEHRICQVRTLEVCAGEVRTGHMAVGTVDILRRGVRCSWAPR